MYTNLLALKTEPRLFATRLSVCDRRLRVLPEEWVCLVFDRTTIYVLVRILYKRSFYNTCWNSKWTTCLNKTGVSFVQRKPSVTLLSNYFFPRFLCHKICFGVTAIINLLAVLVCDKLRTRTGKPYQQFVVAQGAILRGHSTQTTITKWQSNLRRMQ